MNVINKIKTVLLSALVSSVFLAPIVSADDTEIFFGQSADAFNTNPNVLFVLDTSGSMAWFDDGIEGSRMDRLKAAMRILLQESSSFNVGLMGFQGSNRGGSIRYPIGDLEGDSGNLCPDGICEDERVVVKPSSSSDDATQNDDTGVVTLNALELMMAEIEESSDIGTVDLSTEITGTAVAVAVSAENELDGGSTDTRAITGPSKWFFSGVDGSEDDRYAYRFEDVAIPRGATVTSATLSFMQTNAAAQVGNLSALIKLEVQPNPEELPDGVNGFPTIAQRLTPGKATDGIAWNNIPPDTTGASPAPGSGASNIATTPDLSEIVNQIVNLPNWVSGNAMSFILDPVDEYQPAATDTREFHGTELDSRRPVLSFTYSESIETDITTTETTATAHLDELTEQNTNTVSRNLTNPSARTFFASSIYNPRKLAFRFDNIDIPSNAEIQTATLILTGAAADSDSDEAEWTVDTTTVTTGTGLVTVPSLTLPDADTVTDDTAALTTAQENILTLNITAEKTGTPLAYDNDPLATRDLTSEFLAWENVVITPDKELSSPNIASVIGAVINGDSWATGDNLSLVLSAPTSYNNVRENSALIQTAAGAAKPSLHITWKAGDTTDSTLANSQTTAIRFQNVHVPPGATIKSARLVFKSSKASIGENKLEISAEDVANSAALTSADNNIGERARTPERVTWEVEPWNIPNFEYNSPDIKEVIQSITNLEEWCGGNPLTVFLKKSGGDDSRHAVSFDGNEVSAPTLEITYAPDSVSSGAYCSNATLLPSIIHGRDDAVEDTLTNVVDQNSTSLDSINPTTGNPQVIGLRFLSIGVPKDAGIVSATLELTHEKDITQAQDYEFKAVSTIDNNQFNNSDAKILTTERPTYPTTVTATVQPGTAPDSVFQVDVTTLLREKTSDENWVEGNKLVLTAQALGGIAQSFYAFDGDEARVPRLVISYQSQRDQPGTRFRDNLIEIVDDMVAQSGTPIVGSYYEAAQYFLGESIDYGLRRGNQGTQDRFHRVSHPGSYTNGVVSRDAGCSDADINADACISETIQPENGQTPTYISPIISECQQNHIVLLSDGAATSNTAVAKIQALTGDTACVEGGSNACGRELAGWLHTTDIDPVLNGEQNVTTHTIGFNLEDPALLTNLAADGGGSFYTADTSAALLNAFKNIFINVSKTDTSFVAPSATVSQSNRLKNRDDIYFSLFKPEGTARWAGNLKRYRLGAQTGENADIFDVNDKLAVDERTGRFFPTAQSFWSSVADGDSVLLGGAAEKIETNGVSHTAREVYTYTGGDRDLTNDARNEFVPGNTNIDRDWLKLTASLAADDDYVTSLLNWARGKDEFDIDGDGETEEARAQMGDPMHSQPLLVNYAGGKSVVHVATNEGFIHAIDHETGMENFAFIPKELMKNLRRNYENEPTRNRPYGLDGGMTLWIDDANNNGIVDADTDKAYLYIGMRRGGNLYYALDITNPLSPRYLWSIQGGSTTLDSDDATAEANFATANGNFEELGDTWSKPIKTKIYDNEKVRDVLVFGAGYGSNQDPVDSAEVDPATAATAGAVDTRQKREEDTVGRGFFIVDAVTGSKIWSTPLADPDYKEMRYSVPSDLSVIDINFDGLVDQIYFGDMGGQVWRFDYNNDEASDDSIDVRMTGGPIGSFADDTPEGARRFYYPPDIALLSVEGEQQLSISIGSGWRAHPLDDVVEDRFYHFRMRQVYGAPRTEDGKVRYPVITEGTSRMDELKDTDVARTASKLDRGWFLPLRPGEKVLSSSITLDSNVVFTSYVPSAESGTCAAAVGSGSVYYLDAATGNPVQDLDGSNSENTGTGEALPLDSEDRRRALANAGIPPSATVMFPEAEGGGAKATAFVGKDKLDEVQIPTLKLRTYWQEYIEENL